MAINLVDGVADEYEALIKSLISEGDWGEKFSEKYLDKALRQLLGTLSAEEDLAEPAPSFVQDLVDRLDGYSRKQTTYVPLVGIQLDGDEYEFGQVTLETMSEGKVEQLVKMMESAISSSKSAEEVKSEAIVWNRPVLESLEGTVCARFEAVAEPIRMRERAEEECRRCLDLLRYAIPSLYPKDLNVAVGLSGEVAPAQRLTPTFSSDAYDINMKSVGPLMPFEFDPRNIEIMEQLGVLEVSTLLKKPHTDLTNYENALLRGIHWFADAQVQPEIENKLLSLTACLETFLTPKDGSPIGNSIAEGAAMMIADDLESRRYLKRRVKQLYGMRSGVSHGGRKVILEPDLAELTAIARVLTMKMIERKGEFQSQKALLGWIEEQKLT
jgi:hypothetical protein